MFQNVNFQKKPAMNEPSLKCIFIEEVRVYAVQSLENLKKCWIHRGKHFRKYFFLLISLEK